MGVKKSSKLKASFLTLLTLSMTDSPVPGDSHIILLIGTIPKYWFSTFFTSIALEDVSIVALQRLNHTYLLSEENGGIFIAV